MTRKSPSRILATTFAAAALPFAVAMAFPFQLKSVMEISSYLSFHNIAEFFSIMVSLSLFGVGWYAYDQSRDRHALFLGTAFLAVGLVDFMHTMSNAAMPAFITANSTNKSTQYWIAARLLDASALFASAFVYPDRPVRWLTKRALLAAALGATAAIFMGVTFFPSHLPATFVPGAGLTATKVVAEYLVISFLIAALVAYWRRMTSSGDRLLVYYMAAFVIGVFSEAAFASYKSGFDTYNVLGHVYKVVAFYLIYRGAFAASVRKPYVQLSRVNEKLSLEVGERRQAEERVRALNAELEQRVAERTARLEVTNRELERKEEEARERAVELEAVLNCIADGVIVYDRAGRTIRSTPAADEMLRIPVSERLTPVGERAAAQYEILSEDGRPVAPEDMIALRAAVKGEHVKGSIQRVRSGHDEPRWLLISGVPLLVSGKHTGAVLSLTDITDRKRFEEALREADRRKNEFLAVLSHELRNPLAPIRNSVEVLRRADPGGEQARRAQDVIARQAAHLARLVDDLLDVTRIARGKIALQRSRVDLREVVARAAEDFELTLERRGVTFRKVLPGERVWADADTTRITQVVGNLLHNAAKFTDSGGEVTLSLQVADRTSEIRVRDTGSGIDPALLPRVFEAFVQGETTLARTEGGLGLGLALVKGIAEMHGGSVRVESQGKGKGAEFVVGLPILDAAA
jgi:signal transduction histidine kinase